MMKWLWMVGLIWLMACQAPPSPSEKLRIAAAANTQHVIELLAREFTQSTGVETEIVVGSSGKLFAQIQHSAPFDVFVSADMHYPELLYQSSRTAEAPRCYAEGILVLWSMNLEFREKKVSQLAIANPEIAPYGKAAKYYLDQQPYSAVELVYGESIGQVNQFITTQAVEAGITSKSSVMHPNWKQRGKWITLPKDQYPAIQQGAVSIIGTSGQVHPQAKKFISFLLGQEAKRIFVENGYQLPHE